DRDELASWLNDQRTLGQLARRRGFRDQRALAPRLVRARADHPRCPRRRVLEQRALDTLTHAHLARHVLFHIYHSPAVGTAARHGRPLHAPSVPHDRPAARLRRARLPPARAALNRGAAGTPPA